MLRAVSALLSCAVLHAAQVPVGLTRDGTVIEATVFAASKRDAPRVVLIGALPGKTVRRDLQIVAIPEPNPDRARLQFPPPGKAYRDHPESHAVWRWIAMQAPDLVLIAGDTAPGLAEALNGAGFPDLGTIPARTADPDPLRGLGRIAKSPVRLALERRLRRTPAEVSRALEPHYGHEFKEAVYIPAMALMARVRMGSLDDVVRIAAPWAEGADSLAKATGSHLSGHLLFAELATRTRDPRWLALTRKAADLGFHPDGSMKESMPFHNEMSDAVFMGCPILARAGSLTGERKYFDMAARHARFMEALCRRPDGLWRHSPLDEAAWGRGNAFPALGLALTLADFPAEHPERAPLLTLFRELMDALAKAQAPATGMWRQVVDHRGAYPEFSATAMIGRAMLLGVRNGWLDAHRFTPVIEAAWRAVAARVGEDGTVMDVCESTGKQKSLSAYLGREALWGHDPRGGGMALMFAVERMTPPR